MSEDPPSKMRPSPPSDLSRTDVKNDVKPLKDEGNLLIDAVALLVQRQRETESWVAEQIWQAEERASATDRRYMELNERLEGIEAHLSRLVHEIEPPRGEVRMDERLARLREQVEGLRSGAEPTPVRNSPWPSLSARPSDGAAGVPPPDAAPTTPTGVPAPHAAHTTPAGAPAPHSEHTIAGEVPSPDTVQTKSVREAAGSTPPAPARTVSFWDLLGASPEERFGLLLIALGAVAILYAILTQLRLS